MACSGIHALDPVCQAKNVAGHLADDAFSKIASSFGRAAASAADWLWRQLDSATSLDLTSRGVEQDLLVTGAIAGVLTVGLFLIQIIVVVLRREPGGIARSLRGLVVATVGATFAVAVTRILLAVVDQLAAGVVQVGTGQNIDGMGRKFAIASGLGGISNPAVMLLMAIGVLLAVAFMWFAMMTRKVLLIVSAVFTPIAFAGGTADVTRAWVRRWIEFTAALIASKLLLVIILMVGLSVVDGAGQSGSGTTQKGTQLIGGMLILMLGGFAPFLALRMVHFVGESLAAVHMHGGVVQAGAQTALALPQKAARMSSSLSSAVRTGSSGAPPATPSAPTRPAQASPASTNTVPQSSAAPTPEPAGGRSS